MRPGRLFVAFFAAALLSLPGGTSARQPVPRPAAAVTVPAPSGVSGWMVVDLDTGEVVDSANADHAFAPASVAKLPTAAYALEALGPAHRFETRVLATGPVRSGIVQGDLVLQGGGDPELDTDGLLPLVRDLRATGVVGITGELLADGSALPQVSQITPGQEVDAAYNPSVSGLNLNFNRVHVKWDARRGHESLSVVAESDSKTAAVDIVGVSLTSEAGAPVFSFREQDGRELWEMSRRAYRGRAARWLPVKRPETYAAEVFRTLAAEEGVRLPLPRIGTAGDGMLLAARKSRPLADILRGMLEHSTNLTAEVVGSAATRASGIAAERLADSAAVMNTWAAGVASFPTGDPGFRMVNHSGLTLDSRVSPRRLVELLAALARNAPAVQGRMPGGVAQYLPDYQLRGKDPAPKGLEIAAKTGTMNYVCGLAGYIVTPHGHRLAFAVFSNDLARRGDGPERVDHHWMARARIFERALVRYWVERIDKG